MNENTREIIRYGINGLAATALHYGALTFNLKVIGMTSAGLANLIAAVFGISASFFGNRYFVFPATGESIVRQAVKFSGLYGAIAILHGLVLLLWADWCGFDYSLGFLIATGMQVSLSYFGNKFLVFKS